MRGFSSARKIKTFGAILECLIVMTAVLSGLVYFISVFAEFDQNDFMYAVAPAFWRSQTLYQGLMFVQAPGSIFVYGLIYDLVDPSDFHLVLRLFTLSVLFLSVFLLYRTARLLGGHLPALLALIVIFTSYFMATVGREIGNTSLALLFLTGALYLYVSRAPKTGTCALVGVLIGFAAASKLNFALYAIPFGLFIALRLGFFSNELIAYVVGGIAGSCMIWYYALLDFDHFWFFNVAFHYLRKLQRESDGWHAWQSILKTLGIFLILASPIFYVVIKAARKKLDADKRRRFVELTALFATSLAAAFAPLYAAPQYLVPPLYILSVWLAMSVGILVDQAPAGRNWLPLAIGLVWVVPFWIWTFPSSLELLITNRPAPLELRAMKRRIDGIADTYLSGTPCPMSAISLSAAPLLGTPFKVSQFSASGPFLPQVSAYARIYAPEYAHYGSVSEALHRAPVTAFLVGYFPDLPAEREMMRYANSGDFRAFGVGSLPGYRKERPRLELELLVRRSCLTGAP